VQHLVRVRVRVGVGVGVGVGVRVRARIGVRAGAGAGDGVGARGSASASGGHLLQLEQEGGGRQGLGIPRVGLGELELAQPVAQQRAAAVEQSLLLGARLVRVRVEG